MKGGVVCSRGERLRWSSVAAWRRSERVAGASVGLHHLAAWIVSVMRSHDSKEECRLQSFIHLVLHRLMASSCQGCPLGGQRDFANHGQRGCEAQEEANDQARGESTSYRRSFEVFESVVGVEHCGVEHLVMLTSTGCSKPRGTQRVWPRCGLSRGIIEGVSRWMDWSGATPVKGWGLTSGCAIA